MNKLIVHTNERGGVTVYFPTGSIPVEQVQKKDVPVGVASFIIDRSDLPEQNLEFFDAWEQTGGKVTVNLQKAREVTKTRLRVEREPLLVAQDVAFQRALEAGTSTAAIIAEKQRLRNLPLLADSVQSLMELRALKAE